MRTISLPLGATVILAWIEVKFSLTKDSRRRFKLAHRCVINKPVEKIDAQQDHLGLEPFKPGTQVTFKGRPYKIQRRTTLASGEAALVLEGEKEQFVISANQFLADVK